MTVAVLIVTETRRAAESVPRISPRTTPKADHVIVDNGSTDDSLLTIIGVELIRLSENVRVREGANIAARAAKGFDTLASLNPATRLPSRDGSGP